ncbi:MAG TPA: hypothetical protein VMT20_09465 [Terriglobia bacterium]|nr:hypothetical protein [Terriglobia bacterium]
MAEEKTNNGARFDPMSAWREMRDTYLDNWAKVMVEAVNTDAYAQATGTLLDNYLTASAPFREALEKVMLSTLAQLSLPSRADFVSVAERITNLEMRLDDMDAKLDRIERYAAQSAGAKGERRGKQGGQK